MSAKYKSKENEGTPSDILGLFFMNVFLASIAFGLFYSAVRSNKVLLISLSMIVLYFIWALKLIFTKGLKKEQIDLYKSFTGVVGLISCFTLCLTVTYFFLGITSPLYIVIYVLLYILFGFFIVQGEEKKFKKKSTVAKNKTSGIFIGSFSLFGVLVGQMIAKSASQNGNLIMLVVIFSILAFVFEFVAIAYFYRGKN